MSVVPQVLEIWLREGAAGRGEIMEGKTLHGLYIISCTGATIKGKQVAVEDWLSV